MGLQTCRKVVFYRRGSQSHMCTAPLATGLMTYLNLKQEIRANAHETREPIVVFARRLFWSISIHFVAVYSSAAKNRITITKPLIFGVQGHPRSSTLTFLRSSSLVLVMHVCAYLQPFLR